MFLKESVAGNWNRLVADDLSGTGSSKIIDPSRLPASFVWHVGELVASIAKLKNLVDSINAEQKSRSE